MADAGRVIAGSARGTRLEAAPEGTRPLTDRVKEALFASLESSGALDGPFLDVFAGSGAAGIEALSRGAPSATFIEKEGKACRIIGDNLRRAHVESNGHVVRADAVSHLSSASAQTRTRSTAALLDPPYGDVILERTLELLGDDARGWLADGATVVAKHFWRDDPPETVGSLVRTRQKRFGETVLSFYSRSQAPGEPRHSP
jgi:16S rRNA (guanine966-N2)-methyltransferase